MTTATTPGNGQDPIAMPSATSEPAASAATPAVETAAPAQDTGTGTGLVSTPTGLPATPSAQGLPAPGEPVPTELVPGPATAPEPPGLPDWLAPVADWAPWTEPMLRDSVGQPAIAGLLETAGNGGPVLLVLGLLSIAALTIVLVKLWQLTRLRVTARRPVDRALDLWYLHQPEEAIASLEGKQQPAARLVHRAMIGLCMPGTDLDLLREELTRYGLQMLEGLCRGLRTLEVIATLSPLLGLLGTVLGMIEAFRQLQLAGNQVDPAILSGGIWQALLTTAVGLGVAIPVVMLHTALERKVERAGHLMDDAVTRVFTRDLAPRKGAAVGLRSAPAPGRQELDDAA